MEHEAIASILIKTFHILKAFLSCRINVEHLPKVSNTGARIVNNLARKSTTTKADLKHISHKEEDIPKAFSRWLKKKPNRKLAIRY
jgi:hypothetical protein